MSGTADFSVKGDFSAISVLGIATMRGRFQAGARVLHDKMHEILLDEAEQIAEMARLRVAELFKNPAKMQESIRTTDADDIGGSGSVSQITVTASGLPYLRIHEYGGVISTPEIFPVNAAVLHWMAGDRVGGRAAFSRYAQFRTGGNAATNDVFAASTRAHLTVIPERSYMRYALAQRASDIRARFAEVGAKSLNVSY